MELAEIKKDLVKYNEKAKKAGYLEFKRELVEQLLPALIAIVEACEETDEQVGAILDDMDMTNSIIQPALAAQLVGTLELGVQLSRVVGELTLDDFSKQRIAALIETYMLAQGKARAAIDEAAVEEEEEEDPDPDGADEAGPKAAVGVTS